MGNTTNPKLRIVQGLINTIRNAANLLAGAKEDFKALGKVDSAGQLSALLIILFEMEGSLSDIMYTLEPDNEEKGAEND